MGCLSTFEVKSKWFCSVKVVKIAVFNFDHSFISIYKNKFLALKHSVEHMFNI